MCTTTVYTKRKGTIQTNVPEVADVILRLN